MKCITGLKSRITPYLHSLLNALIEWRFSLTPKQDLVRTIIQGVANLELSLGEKAYLKTVKDMYGKRVTLYGNSLPTFEYWVFDSELMEFILVKAELSLPDRIEFHSHIIDHNIDKGPVPVKEEYKIPFMVLASHISRYFPLERSMEKDLQGARPYAQGTEAKETT